MSEKKIARFIRTTPSRDGADAKLYVMVPPYDGNEYVVVSANTILGRPETYVFSSDSDGTITNWSELECSFIGELNHARALEYAGYELDTNSSM